MKRQQPFGTLLFVGAALLCLVSWGAAHAQTGTATIRGTVSDAQGSPVTGATVTVANPAKNFSRTQTTSDEGTYTFSQLPPDTYRVEVEATGFKKSVVTDVSALVDTPHDLDVALEVGNVTETVDVSASVEAPLNTTDATIGNTFESRRIEQLPLNARNVVGLLSLQPGVTRLGEVNGGRRDQANVTLDGVDVNEQQSGLDIVTGDAFGSVLRVTPSSVQEFRVTTSVPTANQGRTSGAQVSLITKSGTNEFHGDVYHFHRNTVTTANDFFNNQAGRFTADDPDVIAGIAQAGDERVPRPKLIRNIFGGSLGGPIMRDKLFFFYNYEGRRDAAEVSVLRTVPTETLRQGIVRYRNVGGGISTLTPEDIATFYPGTVTAQTPLGVNPAGLALLQTAPLPNTFSTGDGLNTGGFRFNSPIKTELNTHIAKFDWVVTDRQTLYVRGNYQDDIYEQERQFPTTPAPALTVNPKGFVLGHSWTATNSIVNNFRVGLTRQAFTQGTDCLCNTVSFRFVYTPFVYTNALSRTTPVWNITDDVSWIKGTHNVQFGTNLRFIRNNRTAFANSFDTAIVNPSFYANSGTSLSNPLRAAALGDERVDTGFLFDVRAAVASVLGRFSQISANVNYDLSGQPLGVGVPTQRSFATEEYEFYGLDTWKITPSLTLTYGLRWGINTPVYERNGFEVKPTVGLGEFFERRQAAAAQGQSLNELITVELSGKSNDRPGFYETDWNNFAPNVSLAWTPDFGDNWFGRAIGRNGRSVIRGGFRQVYDRIGSALAVGFDLNNTLGFTTASSLSANTINTSSRIGPLFTGLTGSVRDTPFLDIPGPITFPLTLPADEQQRIEQTIDDTLTTPTQYTWNLTYGRELPKGLSFEVSYIGRAARNLGLIRDVMHLNNIKDPSSGQTWYEAAGVLADLREQGIAFDDPNFPSIPFFENLYPGNSLAIAASDQLFGEDVTGFYEGFTPSQIAYSFSDPNFINLVDWTFFQAVIDDYSPVIGPNAFFHPQYAALGVFSTVGSSDYHGGTFSLRHRFRNDFLLDFNYTFAKSMDDSSNLESEAVLTNLIRQPLNLEAQRSVSDFDIRHNINANWLISMPFGRGRRFLSDSPTVVNALLGGWQLSGIMRYHTGLPAGSPFDVGLWATNWQLTSFGVRRGPVRESNNPHVRSADPNDPASYPNIFNDPEAAYTSFRNARAGEVGDRNTFRIPSYFTLDAGLSKGFDMWYAEGHRLTFRWEVFNVTNTQRFNTLSAFGLNQDPHLGGAPADFGRYIDSQTPIGESRPGRVMQFALVYDF